MIGIWLFYIYSTESRTKGLWWLCEEWQRLRRKSKIKCHMQVKLIFQRFTSAASLFCRVLSGYHVFPPMFYLAQPYYSGWKKDDSGNEPESTASHLFAPTRSFDHPASTCFRALYIAYMIPALSVSTGYMFSRAPHDLRVFPLLTPFAYFCLEFW